MNAIREIRKEKGLTQETLSNLIGVRREYLCSIETQKVSPTIATGLKLSEVLETRLDKLFFNVANQNEVNYPNPIRFVDLFSGIGGFRYAAQEAFDSLNINGQCVFSSDIDNYARKSYEANFHDEPAGDITQIEAKNIPDFDLLFGGFPCQTFSICGKQEGFSDTTKGTLFFDIARILREKRPQAFVLENVKNLASHDNGKTLRTIMSVLRNELDYYVSYKVLNALDFGLPQKRERCLIVGSKKPFVMPWNFNIDNWITLNDILEDNVDSKYFASNEIVDKRRAMHESKYNPAIWHENKSGNITSYPYSCALRAGASYNYLLVNGERRLTPREMLRLQGFPDSFHIVVSDAQIRKQAGNAIPVNMVSKVIEQFLPLAF